MNEKGSRKRIKNCWLILKVNTSTSIETTSISCLDNFDSWGAKKRPDAPVDAKLVLISEFPFGELSDCDSHHLGLGSQHDRQSWPTECGLEVLKYMLLWCKCWALERVSSLTVRENSRPKLCKHCFWRNYMDYTFPLPVSSTTSIRSSRNVVCLFSLDSQTNVNLPKMRGAVWTKLLSMKNFVHYRFLNHPP